MADPVFGIAIRRIDEDPRPVLYADLSTIGIIGPCDSADPDLLPLNDPVHVDSNRTNTLKAMLGLGDSQDQNSRIPDAIDGINYQLGETQFAARLVIVRTAYGVDADPSIKLQKTINNIVGSSITATGIWAFTKSAHKLGFTPRIIVAPGYTSQMATGVGEVTRTFAGSGYTDGVSYPITFSGGGANGVQATGHAYGRPDGKLGPVELDTPGAWYTEAPTLTAPAPYKSITAAAIADGGEGHQVGDYVTFPNGVIVSVDAVTDGVISAISIVEAGRINGFEAGPTNPQSQIATTGSGGGAKLNLTWAEATADHEVSAAVVQAGGTGYEVGDTITLANGVKLDVATVDSGAILTVTVDTVGSVPWWQETPANPAEQVSTTGGGSGATFDLTWDGGGDPASITATYTCVTSVGANPVCAALTPVLNQLFGHAIVESAGTSEQNDIDWRETMQSQRLIPISGGCRVQDPVTSNVVFRPLAPRIAGILVRRDHEKGAPFHSAANQPVQGIVGPMRDIPFSLTDDANEAQELLGFNIGVIVRGEVGDDFAIASGGFVFIGTDNAGEDELWRFYNVMRGRDFIHLGLLRALRYFLGRYNIVGHTIMAILNTMKFFLRDLHADNHILGYKVTFRADGNSAESIRLGHLTVGFKAEEPPVLRKIIIESARYRDAIDAMVADVAAQLNLSTA